MNSTHQLQSLSCRCQILGAIIFLIQQSQSTVFRHSANLSALEFVPASSGSLLVDIVVPSCPIKKDSTTGELVAETKYSFRLFSLDRLTPSGAHSLALVSRPATHSWGCRTTGTQSGALSGSAQLPLLTSASLRACATTRTPALSTAEGSGVRTPWLVDILSRWGEHKTTQTQDSDSR